MNLSIGTVIFIYETLGEKPNIYFLGRNYQLFLLLQCLRKGLGCFNYISPFVFLLIFFILSNVGFFSLTYIEHSIGHSFIFYPFFVFCYVMLLFPLDYYLFSF